MPWFPVVFLLREFDTRLVNDPTRASNCESSRFLFTEKVWFGIDIQLMAGKLAKPIRRTRPNILELDEIVIWQLRLTKNVAKEKRVGIGIQAHLKYVF